MANAEALNNPPIAVESPQQPLITPGSGLVVETVKIAEDGGIIFRVREPYGRPISGSLSFDPSLDPSTLHETNMLEEPEGDGSLSFHPFQVKTFQDPSEPLKAVGWPSQREQACQQQPTLQVSRRR
jgi:hypothetical protein